jgi:hypothetical protein
MQVEDLDRPDSLGGPDRCGVNCVGRPLCQADVAQYRPIPSRSIAQAIGHQVNLASRRVQSCPLPIKSPSNRRVRRVYHFTRNCELGMYPQSPSHLVNDYDYLRQ